MEKDQLMDLLQRQLEVANVHAGKLKAMVEEAKASKDTMLSKEFMFEMETHRVAWTEAIEKHNELARQLFPEP